MFIRSTGLGRTLLRGRIAAIHDTSMVPSTLEAPPEGVVEPLRMLMVMEILHPVHWTVRAFVDPADLREMVWIVLKNPALIFKAVKFFFSKSPVYQTAEEGEAPKAAAGTTPSPKPAGAQAPAMPPKPGPGPIPAARPGPGPIPSR